MSNQSTTETECKQISFFWTLKYGQYNGLYNAAKYYLHIVSLPNQSIIYKICNKMYKIKVITSPYLHRSKYFNTLPIISP